jgi:hypothetical protein
MGNFSSNEPIILSELDIFHIEIMESIKKSHECRLANKVSEYKELLILAHAKKLERIEFEKTFRETSNISLKLSGDKCDESLLELSNVVALSTDYLKM